MPRIQLNISDQHRLWINSQTSEYFGISDVIRGLLDDAMGKRVIPLHMVDKPDTLPAYRVGAGEQETEVTQPDPDGLAVQTSSQNFSPPSKTPGAEGDARAAVPKAKAVGKKRKRAVYPVAFEEFWKVYQSSPSKANGQSKPRAFEAWGEITYGDDLNAEEQAELVDNLHQAAINAIAEQKNLMSQEKFCSPLPDCFRWLRDGRYESALENHKAEEVKPYEPKHPASRVFTAESGFGEAW